MQQWVSIGIDVVCVRLTHYTEHCSCYGLWRQLDTRLLNANLVHHVGTAHGSAVDHTPGCLSLIRSKPLIPLCKIMSHSAPTFSSDKMVATSLHVGRLRVHKSTPGASWIANRTLRIYWFRINSPSRRNISTNELTWLRTRWIVTISLSKPFIILHCIFTCAYVSLSKTYSWAEFAVLDSSCSNELPRWISILWRWNVYTPSRAFASRTSIRIFSASDAVVESGLELNNRSTKTTVWNLEEDHVTV